MFILAKCSVLLQTTSILTLSAIGILAKFHFKRDVVMIKVTDLLIYFILATYLKTFEEKSHSRLLNRKEYSWMYFIQKVRENNVCTAAAVVPK
jgi:hypothetical protein